VVFGGFGSPEVATRINDATPKVIVAASCGVEPSRVIPYMPLVDSAIELANHKPSKVICLQRDTCPAELKAGQHIDWHDAMAAASPQDCVPMLASDPLYLLYTSGTTGQPKGIVRGQDYAVALKWSMDNFMCTYPGETYWAASDIGWVVGHSYIVYAPLLQGCTTVVFEGKPVGTPDAGTFWRVCQEYGVHSMFTAPTALRAMRRDDPNAELLQQYSLPNLRALFVAGERCDPDTINFYQNKLGIDCYDNWWQTETGWPICGFQTPGIGMKAGSTSKAIPGYNVQVVKLEKDPTPSVSDEARDRDDHPVVALDQNHDGVVDEQEWSHAMKVVEQPPGTEGALAIKLPLPPGFMQTLWKNDGRFVDAYMSAFPGYYQAGDAGFIDQDGYVSVMARTDDVINVAGHRLSTGALEEVLISHPEIAECAVVGAEDALKGQLPLGLIVLNSKATSPPDQVVADTVQMVREKIGPVAAYKNAVVVTALPKTRSGKILRGIIQKIADNKDYVLPGTIEDATIVDTVKESLIAANLVKKS